MSNFVAGDVHVQAALTNLSVAFAQRGNFRSQNIFPAVAVNFQADKYHVFNRQDWLRADAAPRAPGTESAGGGFNISQNTYFCDREAIHLDIDDPTRANADPALSNLDADATDYVTEQVLLREEKKFTADFMTTGVWDGASSSTDMTGQANPSSTSTNFRQWSDVASTPIEDIRGEAISIVKNTGRFPSGLALAPETWQALADHPDILERIKYVERGIVSEALLASLWNLRNVDVLFGTNDSAVEDSAASMAFLTTKDALLYFAPTAPGLRTPSAGYRFVWTGNTGTPLQGARIKKFRMEHLESDRIEGERWWDDVKVSSVLAAFFTTAVA